MYLVEINLTQNVIMIRAHIIWGIAVISSYREFRASSSQINYLMNHPPNN